ncbi:MAG TPA: DHH family phosphoesterase [Candidatus Dojkabacteria bacterium]|nr:DHH family phosphoesterase [Candidatus Dojkabacteria bacterium]
MKNILLFDYIKQSKRILITSHFSPDPDSIGSALYVYNMIKSDIDRSEGDQREIRVCIEGLIPSEFSFLKGFSDITHTLLVDCVKEYEPDLLIMLDGNNLKRFSKLEEQASEILQLISTKSIKTVTIDHHLEDGRDDVDIFINNKRSSTCEEVYGIFTRDFGWETDKSDMEPILFGILGDTGRFLYKNGFHRETFDTVSDMLDAGLSIEELQGRMNSLSLAHIKIIGELMKNLQQKDDYNYSYLSDEFTEKLVEENIAQDIYGSAYHLFMDNYIRSIEPNKWGFVLIPDMTAPRKYYKGSFRAISDLIDTTIFAKLLGGGGHKPASGFKIEAQSFQAALDIVHQTIVDNRVEAYANK